MLLIGFLFMSSMPLGSALWNGFAKAMASSRATFACGKEIKQQLPSTLHVQGLGKVALPLGHEDWQQLLKLGQQAPYGKGTNTVLDTRIRQAWQIDSSNVCPQENAQLFRDVQTIGSNAVAELGLDPASLGLEVNLYKLLMYDGGGHFKAHRDLEKEPGMFATLVIQLPTRSGFQGGTLAVRHRGLTKEFDFSQLSSSRFFYTAFFADCQHELQPITGGSRLALVFNLSRKNSSNTIVPTGYDIAGFLAARREVDEALAETSKTLFRETPKKQNLSGPNTPTKLVIPLEHKYTEANLCFAGLKGQDRMVVELLLGRTDWKVYLCILTRHETYASYGNDNRLSHFVASDGSHPVVDGLEVNCSRTEELIDDDFEWGEPDKTWTAEYMGNQGGEENELYRRAAVVVWPKGWTIRNFGLLGMLDIVEKMNKQQASDAIAEILDFCRGSGVSKLCYDAYIHYPRLVQVWLDVCDIKDTVGLINALAENQDFKAKQLDLEAAKGIARLIHRCGWEACGATVLDKLVTAGTSADCAGLANELATLGLQEAAVQVANKVIKLLMRRKLVPAKEDVTEMVIASLEEKANSELSTAWKEAVAEMVEENVSSLLAKKISLMSTGDLTLAFFNVPRKRAVAEMVLTLVEEEEVHKEMVAKLILDFPLLVDVVSRLAAGNRFDMLKRLLKEKHEDVVQKIVLLQKGSSLDAKMGLRLMEMAILLEDEQILDALVKGVLSKSRSKLESDTLVEELLRDESVWNNKAWETSMGKKAVQELANEAVSWKEARIGGGFSWCQPCAEFKWGSSISNEHEMGPISYKRIEDFLRGPMEDFFCTGFGSRAGAKSLAEDPVFDGKCHNGMSATAEVGGRGSGSFVVIRKTAAAHKEFVARRQREVKILKDKLKQLKKTSG